MNKIFDTVAEAGEFLRCGRTNIYKMLGQGMIRGVKLGRSTKILHADLLALVDRLPNFEGRNNRDQTPPHRSPAKQGGPK